MYERRRDARMPERQNRTRHWPLPVLPRRTAPTRRTIVLSGGRPRLCTREPRQPHLRYTSKHAEPVDCPPCVAPTAGLAFSFSARPAELATL